jgi:hypothetical protein
MSMTEDGAGMTEEAIFDRVLYICDVLRAMETWRPTDPVARESLLDELDHLERQLFDMDPVAVRLARAFRLGEHSYRT